MAEAAKHHLRECKPKAGTRVYADKTFYSDANASEKFWGVIMKVLPNDNIKVKWDVDITHSIFSLQDVSVVTSTEKKQCRIRDSQPKDLLREGCMLLEKKKGHKI